MDDDTGGYLATSFYLASEAQRRADDEAAQARLQSQRLAQQASDLEYQLGQQATQAKDVENDYWALFNLFKQPMNVIAQRNSFFAKTYNASQRELADIRVRELAFVELALQLGAKLGMSQADVMKTGMQMRADVLHNRFPENHGTNASVSKVLQKLGPVILYEWEGERAAFVEEYSDAIKKGRIYNLLDGMPKDWAHVFQACLQLAKTGDRQAQFNTGYCLTYAKGTPTNVKDAEHWYLMALQAGDLKAAMNLHWLYAWEKGSQYSLEKAESHLKIAEQQGDPRAAGVRQTWNETAQKNQWDREEAEFLKKILIITPGTLPPELEMIKGRGYAWEKAASLLHACGYKIEQGHLIDEGPRNARKWYLKHSVHVKNPTDVQMDISANFWWDEAKYGQRFNWGGSKGTLAPKKTSQINIGSYPDGATYDHLSINVDNNKFESLARFGDLFPSAKHGSLTFQLRFAKPFVVGDGLGW